jgi:uncharacterized protein involved in outer membrane biogenesis
MKHILKIVLIALAVLLVLSLVKNGAADALMETALSKAARVPVRISGTNVSFLKASIRLAGVKFLNPRGFHERNMLTIGKVFVDFDPSALWKGRAHFEEVRFELKELVVIKNKEGKLNVDAMKPVKKEDKQPSKAKPSGEAPKLHIDSLFLTIDKVIYKDYSAGGEPKVEVFDINIRAREYRNINDPQALVSLIMFEALTKTTLGRLANLDTKLFREGFGSGVDIMESGTEKVERAARGFFSLFE